MNEFSPRNIFFSTSVTRKYGAFVQGRATVELTLKKGDPAAKFFVDGKTYDDAKLTLVPVQLGTSLCIQLVKLRFAGSCYPDVGAKEGATGLRGGRRRGWRRGAGGFFIFEGGPGGAESGGV
jgi:hypothetical protein